MKPPPARLPRAQVFGQALQTGQLDLAQFGLNARGFSVADFLDAIQELVEREQVGGRVGTAHPNVPRLTAARIGLLARLGIGQRPVRSTGLPVEGPLLGPPRRLAAPIAAPACLWHSCRPTLPRAEALLPARRPPSRHARG